MTFSELKTALFGRGFQHLSTDRLGEDINSARSLLDDMYLWPYRETSVDGVAPLYVADLGVIEAVTNEDDGSQLQPGDYRSLSDDHGDLAQTGAPAFFYVGQGNIVGTYPTGTATIGVQHYRVTPELVDDTDTPEMPERFHPLILDMAAQRAYMRTDNFQGASALQPWIDQRLSSMVTALLGGQQIAGPQGHGAVHGACDG